MTREDAMATGKQYGYSAGKYCEVSNEDQREAGCDCESGDMCSDCLATAAYASEMNARDFSPWEFVAHDINTDEDSEELWEAYEAGVAQGVQQALNERIRVSKP